MWCGCTLPEMWAARPRLNKQWNKGLLLWEELTKWQGLITTQISCAENRLTLYKKALAQFPPMLCSFAPLGQYTVTFVTYPTHNFLQHHRPTSGAMCLYMQQRCVYCLVTRFDHRRASLLLYRGDVVHTPPASKLDLHPVKVSTQRAIGHPSDDDRIITNF